MPYKVSKPPKFCGPLSYCVKPLSATFEICLLAPQYSIQLKLSQLDFCKIKGLLYDTPTIHHTIDVFISTEGALKLPTTYDNHPSNPIPSPPSIHI